MLGKCLNLYVIPLIQLNYILVFTEKKSGPVLEDIGRSLSQIAFLASEPRKVWGAGRWPK